MTIIVAGFVHRISLPRVMTDTEMQINGLYLLETPRDFGEVSLVDQHGEAFTRERLQGKWTLVFFGFTYCPDICPTTMSFLNDLMGQLEGTEAEDTEVVMVSVDPARDTVEQLAELCALLQSRVYRRDRRVPGYPPLCDRSEYAVSQGSGPG